MTAEVGVINRIGVALAADSAVTVGTEGNKIYTSADKLFQLSFRAPVGVMIFGNAECLEVPWETAIKEYRRELGTRTFDHVEGYAEDFFKFVSQHAGMFAPAKQDESLEALVGGLFLGMKGDLEKALESEFAKAVGGKLKKKQLPPIIEASFAARLSRIKGAPEVDVMKGVDRKLLKKRLRALVLKTRKMVFGSLPLNLASIRHLEDAAFEMILRHHFSPLRSGIVVAGCGELEFMPSLVSYDVDGVVLGHVRRHRTERQRMGVDSSAAIVPFAQREVVRAFLEGVDEGLEYFMSQSTADLFRGAVDVLIEEARKKDATIADHLHQTVRPNVMEALKKLIQGWADKRREHWGPVVEIVQALPKEELAAMAEALVNLTKFRRRVTTDRETVAGPIDVAVITRGDGFVWVKRKHYFPAELNPRVVARWKAEVQP